MSELKINSCRKSSNLFALLAVAEWIKQNQLTTYSRVREVSISSGERFTVAEVQREDELNSCNADFNVIKID